MSKDNRENISITMDADLLAVIDSMAKSERLSRTQWIEPACIRNTAAHIADKNPSLLAPMLEILEQGRK